MRSACEQKEDMRLRMADLERKLAESEEERHKLEKTCNVLMRAFREEEKLHYKALNKKYEKFLEDCSVRRRRNDIILRSLCRIEDRSRALFAKTERLKLLKDRYVSCLKINQFKQDDVSSHFWKNFPFASREAADDVTSKSVRWKTPLTMGPSEEEFSRAKGDFLSRNVLGKYDLENSPGFQESGRQTKSNPTEADLSYPIAVEMKIEELVRNGREITRTAVDEKPREIAAEVTAPTGVEGEGHEKLNEKLGKTLSGVDYSESKRPDPKSRLLPENDDINPNEIDPVKGRNKSFNELPRVNNYALTSGLKSTAYEEEYEEGRKNAEVAEEKDVTREPSPKTDKNLPLGLDGVDYQNETYPESYYEQPVHHHNHTSIASDVILEEDETEQDVEEEEKDLSAGRVFEEPEERSASGDNGHGVKTWDQPKSPKGHGTVVEPNPICASDDESEPSDRGYLKKFESVDRVRSQESDSEKSSERKLRGSASERAVLDAKEKNKADTKSNLIHMLESDSESFQIEHGDGVSGNEDSDFDFSFNKN